MKGLLLAAVLCLSAAAQPAPLETGYRQMYNLQFDDAHATFREWEQAHPDDAMGPVSDAAAYLFTEFERLHILQSEFFAHDSNFTHGVKLEPDSGLRQRFFDALEKAKNVANKVLGRNPKDDNAMFASILRLGLRSDYTGLVEKRYVASFSDMKAGRVLAQKLLARNPQFYDAYLALGVENYMLSLKPAPVRWLLRIGGGNTDRNEGLKQLKITAEHGHYLLPFARLLLAVAAIRDRDRHRAKTILQALATEFPNNRLYGQELARLN